MLNAIRVYEVGGTVRDKILGVPNKDNDFAVEAPSYDAMRDYILDRGRIYLEHPEFFTIRAHIENNFRGAPLDADFVLCRKESTYTDGRRPDSVSVGAIYDDLARRDFTMNAIAIDIETNDIIDPYNGVKDIVHGIIRCVGKAEDRFEEDALRMVRALRFSITKRMKIHNSITRFFTDAYYLDLLKYNISEDRKRDELMRMFKFDTIQTLDLLARYPKMRDHLFGDSIMWLKPTSELR
jgi:tRNA nucleotidyltransferase (CCA-adding enzyme)